MLTSDIQGEHTASAQVFQDAFASYLLMLRDLSDPEIIPVAKSAAKDLVVLIADRTPPNVANAALVEISTLCQHELMSAERHAPLE